MYDFEYVVISIVNYMKGLEQKGEQVGNYFTAINQFEVIHDVNIDPLLKQLNNDHTSLRRQVNMIYYKDLLAIECSK